MHAIRLAGLAGLLLLAGSASARPTVTVGVLLDGEWELNDELTDAFERELLEVTQSEFELVFPESARLVGDFTLERVETLFRRYFVGGEDIGDREVHLAAGEESGLSTAMTRTFLAGGALTEEVRARAREFTDSGITGVPFFGVVGAEAISGAQGAEVLRAAIVRRL